MGSRRVKTQGFLYCELIVDHSSKTQLQMNLIAFFSVAGQTTIDRIKLLADECKYNLTKTDVKPREHAESEQFFFNSIQTGGRGGGV